MTFPISTTLLLGMLLQLGMSRALAAMLGKLCCLFGTLHEHIARAPFENKGIEN